MFTVLVISGNTSVTSFSVVHFPTLAAAKAYQPVGVGCSIQCFVFKGKLSANKAVSLWLD